MCLHCLYYALKLPQKAPGTLLSPPPVTSAFLRLSPALVRCLELSQKAAPHVIFSSSSRQSSSEAVLGSSLLPPHSQVLSEDSTTCYSLLQQPQPSSETYLAPVRCLKFSQKAPITVFSPPLAASVFVSLRRVAHSVTGCLHFAEHILRMTFTKRRHFVQSVTKKLTLSPY